MSLKDFVEEGVVSSLRDADLLIDHGKDPNSFSFQEFKSGAVVDVLRGGGRGGSIKEDREGVWYRNHRDIDPFSRIFLLFHPEGER
jgi:hypothetical protein